METMPKSYLPESEREGLTQNGIYLAECQAARQAGDWETAWEWMRFVKLPAHALMSAKIRQGSDFIREKRLNTKNAEAVYGKNWLEAR